MDARTFLPQQMMGPRRPWTDETEAWKDRRVQRVFTKIENAVRRTLRKTRGGAPHRPRFSAFFKTILIDQQTLMHGCVRPHPPFHPSPTYARTRGSTRPVAQDCILHNFQHLFRHLEDTYGMSSSWYVDGKRLVLISRSGHVSLPICGLDRS